MTDAKKINKMAHIDLEQGQLKPRVINTRIKTSGSSSQEAIKFLEPNSELRKLLKTVEQKHALIGSLGGISDELRKAIEFSSASASLCEFSSMRTVMDKFDARFILPKMESVPSILKDFLESSSTSAMRQYSQRAANIQDAMQSMTVPWLDSQQALKSVRGFANLQGIGKMLEGGSGYDGGVATALRKSLGDWREPIKWPENVFTDFEIRSKFYLERGFDPSLIDFTEPAFRESLDVAGIQSKPPPLIKAYRVPVSHPDFCEGEVDLERTNRAHDHLLRLETNLRQFIDVKMTERFGVDWPKHRLPNGLYEKWEEKRIKANNNRRPVYSLITYADFTDYVLVICRQDNWREVFEPHFCRQADIRETFQRLHPIRLDTMHARPILRDDELLLLVETRRVMQVIIAQE